MDGLIDHRLFSENRVSTYLCTAPLVVKKAKIKKDNENKSQFIDQ